MINLKRNIYNDLLIWKEIENHKPLLINGARQVGKTYLIREFCKNEYDHYVEINLFEREDIVDLYNRQISSDQKWQQLKVLLQYDLEDLKKSSIMFIDEIQESEEMLAALKFFREKLPTVNIICSGSLLGVKLKRINKPFPVGQVQMLKMYPLTFDEFLMNIGDDLLINEIKHSYKNNIYLTQPLHEKSLYNYRQYLCLGGMPEVISNYIENDKDLIKVNKLIADNIIQAYLSDMSKYVDNKSESVKIEQIFNSVPLQLANESKKFQYLKVAPNARSRDYESGLNWLIASSLLLSSNNIPKPDYPIAAYKDSQFFKVFLSDVGLLANLLSISFSDIISNQKFSFKGSITENYVAQELIAKSIPLYYWKSNNLAEVDFLIEYPISQEGIIPIEVKSDVHTQSKSLNIYSQKFNPKYSIRISSKNFGFENGIKSVPLYAVFCIEKSLI